MGSLIHDLDLYGVDAAQSIRSAPLTALFVLASAWWVKWPLIAVVGAARDLRARRAFPRTALVAAGAALSASGIATLVKALTDRVRPPFADPGIEPLVATPESASFPSGHATAAFAAAVAVSVLYPRLRAPLLALASAVALSRVYLGVHYPSDILVGAALGAAIGYGVAIAARRAAPASPSPGETDGSARGLAACEDATHAGRVRDVPPGERRFGAGAAAGSGTHAAGARARRSRG